MSAYLLFKRLPGGDVTRYHTVPRVGGGQNVAAHTWRALVILQTLWPDISREAILHLLYHDAAEFYLGDLPANVKWDYPDLDNQYSLAETDINNTELELEGGISQEEYDRCKMADLLELIVFTKQQFDNGVRDAWVVYKNGVDYLMKHYKTNKDFKPVFEVLMKLRLEEPLIQTDWL